MSNKQIRLKDLNSNILHPETDWSLILNAPTVDQTYSATSTKAQSGVAVASAIQAAIGDAIEDSY